MAKFENNTLERKHMKYRLKNAEMQAKLDSLSKENKFSDMLQEATKEFLRRKQDESTFANASVVYVTFGDMKSDCFGDSSPQYNIRLNLEEIEEIKQYNPYAWNDFPEVTPPECKMMRVEYTDQYGAKRRGCAMFYKNKWVNFDGLNLYVHEARFRPWDEEDE